MKHIKLLLVLGLMTAASTALALGCACDGHDHDGYMDEHMTSEFVSFSGCFPFVHFCCDTCKSCDPCGD